MTAGTVFADPDVAAAYRHRAPYPPETFTILERLLVEPRTVLDLGAGSGALARPMAAFARRVDALDPSVAMISSGRAFPGGAAPNLRWIQGNAEDAPLDPPYGLITFGESLHWMDADRVARRAAAALAPGARMTILSLSERRPRWRALALRPFERRIFDRYDPPDPGHHHRDTATVLADLERSGRFMREGQARTAAVPLVRSVDEMLEALHSTSGFARARLGERAESFDAELRMLWSRAGLREIRREVQVTIVWGRPR